MDSRFEFAEPTKKRPKRMIDAEEYAVVEIMGKLPGVEGGKAYFPLPERPLLFDRRNFFKVEGMWQKRVLGGTWAPCREADHNDVLINENFLAYKFPAVSLRKGYRVQYTDCYLENCRAVWETYVLQNRDRTQDPYFSMLAADPTRHCSPVTTKWKLGDAQYKKYTDQIFKAAGFALTYRPNHLVFGGSDPTHPSPQIIPQLDEQMQLVVDIHRNSNHIFSIKSEITTEYRLNITRMTLVIGIPRLSTFATQTLAQKKVNNVVSYTGVQHPQRLFFNNGEAARTLKIENIRMPDMLVMQRYKKDLLLGTDIAPVAAEPSIYRALAHNVKHVVAVFDGKQLFMDRSMQDYDDSNMKMLRWDRFMRYPPFGNRVNPGLSCDMDDYSAPAVVLDFRSNPETGEKTRPVLAENDDENLVGDLELKLTADTGEPFTEAFLVTMIYNDTYVNLDLSSGSLWAPLLEDH